MDDVRKRAWIVFLVALAVRVAFVIPMPADSYRSAYSSDNTLDSKAYVDVAQTLVDHHLFGYGTRSSAFRPPVYPWFLASVFSLAGQNFLVVRLIQALFGALSALALFGLGHLLWDKRVGLLAGLGLALYPFSIYFAGSIMTEGLFLLLAVGALWLAALLLERGATRSRIVWLGVVAALATLCRPTFLPFLAVGMAAGTLGFVRNQWAALKPLLWAALLAVLLVSPWIARNSLLFGRPTFITTYTGLNLYESLPGKDQITQLQDFGYNYHTIEDSSIAVLPIPERQAEQEQKDYFKRFVQHYPGEYAKEKLGDLRDFWLDFNLAGNLGKRGGLVRTVPFAAYGLILVGGLLATAWLIVRREWLPLAICGTAIVSTMLITLTIFAGKRYRIPTVDPYLILLTAWLVRQALFKRSR
ncbi:MAG: glycosyltransferase family 39 protein [Acidobacteriota bacterium]